MNSGRATREHSIEDTALNTNMEAAEEIARQLRLRDLAGLIVIDFIDMEEKRNNRSVERRLKDCLRADRARIQVGRISHFGLLEMSRQRIRTGVLESSVVPCPHCRGTGQVRSISSLSLQILRALEDHLLRNRGHNLIVRTRPEVALYVLNQKRRHLAQLEARFGLTISFIAEAPENGAGYAVERGAPVENRIEPVGGPATASFRRRSNRSTSRRRNSSRRRPRRKTRSLPPRRASAANEASSAVRASRAGVAAGGAAMATTVTMAHDERHAAQNDRRHGGAKATMDLRRERPRTVRRGASGAPRAARGRERREARSGGGGAAVVADGGAGAAARTATATVITPARADPAAREASRTIPPELQSEPLRGRSLRRSRRRIRRHGGDGAPDLSRRKSPTTIGRRGAGCRKRTMTPAETSPSAVPEQSSEERAAAEVIPMPEPVAPPEAATAPEPIEDDRPKRSGWWSRKGFL